MLCVLFSCYQVIYYPFVICLNPKNNYLYTLSMYMAQILKFSKRTLKDTN